MIHCEGIESLSAARFFSAIDSHDMLFLSFLLFFYSGKVLWSLKKLTINQPEISNDES
jgi:hypothetical protein